MTDSTQAALEQHIHSLQDELGELYTQLFNHIRAETTEWFCVYVWESIRQNIDQQPALEGTYHAVIVAATRVGAFRVAEESVKADNGEPVRCVFWCCEKN